MMDASGHKMAYASAMRTKPQYPRDREAPSTDTTASLSSQNWSNLISSWPSLVDWRC